MFIKIFLNTISADERSHKIIARSGIEISMPIITFGRILLLAVFAAAVSHPG